MAKARYKAPNGLPITGTLESLQGVALLDFIDTETGEPEYSGETTVWWDEQRTICREGKIVYVDEEGGEWIFAQLVEAK